nr:diacylglycerol kinase family protein [bacterium]
MGGIVVIFNPHARRNSKHPGRAAKLSEILGDAGEVIVTEKLDEMAASCAELVRRDVDLIGICGGDGTNHLVLTCLIDLYRRAGRELPPLALLKGGSMNTIRYSLGLQANTVENLVQLVRTWRAGEPWPLQERRVLRVNERYGFFYGNGYAVNFLEEYYNSHVASGARRAAEITYKAIGAVATRNEMFHRLARRIEAEIVVDGRPLAFPSLGMTLLGTIEYIGLGFKPLYRAQESPDHFHAVLTGLTPTDILAQIYRFFTGKPMEGEHHFDGLAREVTIRGNVPIGYTLDGEMYSAPDVHISLGPRLRIIAADAKKSPPR